jgi:hypothetical protein
MAAAGYVSLDDMLPEVMQYCNGAPPIMIRKHLIKSAIALCNKALILKKEPSLFCLEEDVHTYTLKYAGDRYRAVAVDSAQFTNSGAPLRRTTESEMDSGYSNWREQTGTKPTRYMLLSGTNKIRVWPTPTADIDIDFKVRTVVTYKQDQTEIDEFVFEKWHEIIQSGAIAKILMIPGATWFNSRVSQTFTRDFSRGVREARKTSVSGTGKHPGRIMPQDFSNMGASNDGRSGTWE